MDRLDIFYHLLGFDDVIMSIYLTLPANSSKNYYPDNTLTRYTTRLQSPIELQGEWELALVEMSFSRTWFTVPRHVGRITFSCQNCRDFIPAALSSDYDAKDYSADVVIPHGYYKGVGHVVEVINTAIEEASTLFTFPVFNIETSQHARTHIPKEKWPTFRYSDVKKKANILLQPGASVHLSEFLSIMLGYRLNPIINSSAQVKGFGSNATVDIDAGLHGLYVYCDLIENVCVGDTEAGLLRICDSSAAIGENVYRVFNPPRYLPMRRKNFESVEIDIRDDTGNPISFESGTVVVIVHLRRALATYLSI